MNKYINKINSSLSAKLTLITSIIIFTFLISVISINLSGLSNLEESTLLVVEDELEELTSEYYENYLSSISVQIEDEMNDVFSEIHILSSILQSVFTNRESFDDIIAGMKTSELFQDDLNYSGSWYQNNPDEPTSLLVIEYMIDEEDTINDEAMALIENTQILDLILPAFYDYGVDKVQVYFQGGENREIFRVAPWTDLGNELVDVYPEIFTSPVWEAFNPGLAGQWRDKIIESDGNINVINSLLRVTPPVQDGVSGDIVLTVSQPLADSKFEEFEGTVSYDLPINNIIDVIENIKISETGFAFISQSDGNLFGINEQGLNTLGLLNDADSTIDSDIGFNVLERYFADSSYSSVKEIELNNSFEARVELIVIDNKEYFIASKSISGYQSWSSEKGFFQENWQVGFIVPKEEVYGFYNDIVVGMDEDISNVNFKMIIVIMLVAIVLLYSLSKFNSHVTKELTILANAANEVKDNNYNIDVTIKSKDEIGTLANAFNGMVDEIKQSFIRLEEQNIKLKDEIDIRKQKDRIIEYLENFDTVTDLPNKKALLNILKNIDIEGTDNIYLIVIGIDEFRKINEAYSWTFGDRLMNEIAIRLNKLFVEKGTFFKLSGDEFAYVAKENNPKALISLVEDINEFLVLPFNIENHEIILSASIGISSYPFDTSEPEELFKYAIKAMSHAKEVNRGNYEFYNAEINTTARDRMVMISELRNAIENNELSLNYQPIIDSKTRSISGMEALIRWENLKLGKVSPNIFIPLAEKTKTILPIGSWVIRNSLTDAKKLHDMGYDYLNIAINVSIVQFLESNLVEVLRNAILSTGINPNRVTVEITEGLFINDLDKILTVLNALKELGISISVDDFGTGYSSLSYIKNLPLSKLKVDRSFINEVSNEKGRKLTDAIIGLAKNLNLSVIAEGVETEAQLKYLKQKECEEVQGFLFSKPRELDNFIEYLKDKNNTTA